MKMRLSAWATMAMVLGGCATGPKYLNQNNQPMVFTGPVLGKRNMTDARYVLLEKSVVDGKYKLVSMSKLRQPITNERQERIAFNQNLTAFAPDYTDYSFTTYVDRGNYDERTVIMRCGAVPNKVMQYGPCNSAFARVFVPTGVVKAYVAGDMSSYEKKQWDNGPLRYVISPAWALAQAGVFARMADLANAQ